MATFPLHLLHGHLFLEKEGRRWLLDTGSPDSFGSGGVFEIEGEVVDLPSGTPGLSVASLGGFTGTDCAGLLGMNVLGRFDLVLDMAAGKVEVSAASLAAPGRPLPLDDFLGLPIVTAEIGDTARRMFFDTGAQVSYLEWDGLAALPDAGTVEDFYPGFGRFRTATRAVSADLGGDTFNLRCGRLPGLLAVTLEMAGVEGILGNEVLVGRRAGFFPRRQLLVL